MLILFPCNYFYLVTRLRQVDVKAEHFERQIQRVEQERDSWEKKYEVRQRSPALTLPFDVAAFVVFVASLEREPKLLEQMLMTSAFLMIWLSLYSSVNSSLPSHHSHLQEAMEKYAISKRELDEVVSQMEVSHTRSPRVRRKLFRVGLPPSQLQIN